MHSNFRNAQCFAAFFPESQVYPLEYWKNDPWFNSTLALVGNKLQNGQRSKILILIGW
jgi:hypothetical protein